MGKNRKRNKGRNRNNQLRKTNQHTFPTKKQNKNMEELKKLDSLTTYQLKELLPEIKLKVLILDDRKANWAKTQQPKDLVSDDVYNPIKEYLTNIQTMIEEKDVTKTVHMLPQGETGKYPGNVAINQSHFAFPVIDQTVHEHSEHGYYD